MKRQNIWNKRRHKLNSSKCVINGLKFDSKAEAYRYQQLEDLVKSGEISDLQRQVKFCLIPAQREPDIIGPKGGKKPGKLIERSIEYVADFIYKDKNGKVHIEDVKGFREPGSATYKVFIMKRKMLRYFYGLTIDELTIPIKDLKKWSKTLKG